MIKKKQVTLDKLKPVEKCAIVLVAMGVERASSVLKNMPDRDVERVSISIAKLQDISPEVLNGVIEEYYQMMISNQYVHHGGMDYTREVLEKIWDSQRASKFLKQIETGSGHDVFDLLDKVDEDFLISFLQEEHPQTNALILANLSAAKAAAILSELPESSRSEVSFRMATMNRTSPGLIRDVEAAIRNQLGSSLDGDTDRLGGVEAVANILNSLSASVEKNIMSSIREREPGLAEAIAELMFSYDDIVLLDDSVIQRILRDVEGKTLALALKAASEDLKKKVFKNMSERAAAMLKEDIEFLGAVRLKEVEEAQKQVLEVVKALEESGDITINRGEEELVE